MRVWDAVTGNRIFPLKGQRNKVLSLRLLDPRVYPNILLSGGEDKYVHVWNLTTGEPVRVMSGHEDEVTCLSSGEFPYASFAALYNCSPVSAKRTVAGSTVALSEPEMMDHATASSIVSSTNSVSSSRPSSESLEAGVAENCMNAASRDGTVMLIISGSRDKTVCRFLLAIFLVFTPLPWPSLNEIVFDVQPMCPLFYRLHQTMALCLFGIWRRVSF